MNELKRQIKAFVEKDFDTLVSLRREFHRHPEVGRSEFWTAARIESPGNGASAAPQLPRRRRKRLQDLGSDDGGIRPVIHARRGLAATAALFL